MNRAYRKKLSGDVAVKILCAAAGTQLDESIVSVFCGMVEKEKPSNRERELGRLLRTLIRLKGCGQAI
jgi:HD-GYP domain-containing protein (c-di-GMP phosphodiesterase class II)